MNITKKDVTRRFLYLNKSNSFCLSDKAYFAVGRG